MFRLLVCVSPLLLVSLSAAGQDDTTKYDVKLKAPAAAAKLAVTKTDTQKVSSVASFNGNRQEEERTDVRKFTYTDEVLSRGKDGQPDKMKRTYESASFTSNDQPKETFEVNKPITVTRAGDAYSFADGAGKPLSKALAADLDKQFNKNTDTATREALAPKQAVKIGDTWTVDTATLGKALGDDITFDPAKSTAGGKLVAVYPKNNARWGALEYTVELACTKMTAGRNQLPLKAGSKLTLKLLVDTCIDGTDAGYESKAEMTANLEADAPGLELTLKMSSKGTGTGKESK